MEFEITINDTYTVIAHGSEGIEEIVETFPQIETPKTKIKCKMSCGTKKFSRKQWKEKERNYATTYFCTTEDNSILKEAILFPPNQNTGIAKLASNIKRLISNKYNGSTAIITQYNALEHLNFLGYSLEDVRNKLGLSSLINQSERWDDSAVVFLNDLNVVISLRYTLADDISDIEQELIKCKEDLLLFLLVNRDSALSSNICFVNIIAAPNFAENGTVFQSENTFNSVIGRNGNENFDDWFNNIFIPYIKNVSANETDNSAFMDMISGTFTFMATTRIDVPTLAENTDEQIRSLLLSNEQLRAINTSDNKKIIIGGYGSGKSLVAMGQIQELIKKDDKANVKIFYICYDVKTLHKRQMKDFVRSLKVPRNVEVISKNILELCQDLKTFNNVPSISDLLPVLVQQPGQVVHFVIDEFNCESLDNAEAKALKNLLTTSEKLQTSTVVLVAQSMENRRLYHSYDKTIINHDSYKYEETGMKVIHLSKCMRNSINIFKFNNSLQEALSQEKNIFHHPVLSRSTDIEENADTSRSVNIKKHSSSTTVTHDSEEVMSAGKHLESIDANKNELKQPTTMEDLALSLTPELCSSTVNTETSYKYQLCDDVWHNIDGNMPVLLAFESKPSHEEECVAKLAISIERLCFLKKSHALFVANTRKGRLTQEKLLYCLEKPFILYNPDSDWNIIDNYENELEEIPNIKECNLITDYQGCRGLQAGQVVVFLDPDDQYHWPYLVESCARSTDSLVLILIDDLYSATTNILYRCINKAVENCLIEVDTICGVSNTNKEQPLKETKLNFQRQLSINTNSYRYCDYVQKLQSFKHTKFAKTLEDKPLDDFHTL